MTTTGKSLSSAKKTSRNTNKYRIRRATRSTLIYAFLLLLCVIIILPVGWMFAVALKPDRFPVFTIPPQWFPIDIGNGITSFAC